MENVLKITSGRYSMDWFDYTNHELNLDKIWYFTIYYRGGDDWHVGVTEKPKNENKPFHYELGNWVGTGEVKKLIKDERVIVLKIVNTHSSKKFNEMVSRLYK